MRRVRLERQLVAAGEASQRVRQAGDRARAVTVEAIRAVEGRLLRALDGAHLRGLAAVAPEFRGANVRATGRFGIDTFVRPGERALVLHADGSLYSVDVREGDQGRLRVGYVLVRDEDLQQHGDLQAYLRAVKAALRRHLAVEQRTERKYERAADLAERLQRALAGEPPG